MFVGCWGLKPRWLLVCLVFSCSLLVGSAAKVWVPQGVKQESVHGVQRYMHGVHTFFGVGYEGGGLCRGWEALAGYLANFAGARRRPEAGKLLPGTWEASPAGRVGAYRIRPPSATIGGEYMFHIRPLRVRLRGRMRYAPTAGYPAKLRRRPQPPSAILAGVRRRPPKQRGRHAPSETPVSAACWRTIRPSQEYYFPHYMRRTDPATGLVTGVVHMAPPSTMPPSVGGCGRRRSLPGTCGACTRPYSQASVDVPRSREGDTRPAGRPYPPPVGELPGLLKSTTFRTTCAAQTPPRAS